MCLEKQVSTQRSVSQAARWVHEQRYRRAKDTDTLSHAFVVKSSRVRQNKWQSTAALPTRESYLAGKLQFSLSYLGATDTDTIQNLSHRMRKAPKVILQMSRRPCNHAETEGRSERAHKRCNGYYFIST